MLKSGLEFVAQSHELVHPGDDAELFLAWGQREEGVPQLRTVVVCLSTLLREARLDLCRPKIRSIEGIVHDVIVTLDRSAPGAYFGSNSIFSALSESHDSLGQSKLSILSLDSLSNMYKNSK